MQQNHANSDRLRTARRQSEGGYMLLAILLMMALMIIVATYYTAPAMVQQIKRDREEEMVHRGTEYARAIRKFYKKNGHYPASLDDLDQGEIRYLRKRYKDPLAPDGKWKVLHYGDILGLLNTPVPNTPQAGYGSQNGIVTPGGAVVPGVPSPAQENRNYSLPQQVGSVRGFAIANGQSYPSQGLLDSTLNAYPGPDQGQAEPAGSSPEPRDEPGTQQGEVLSNPLGGGKPTSDSLLSQNAGGQQFGGGAIVGVASLSKEKTIRIYNRKNTYNEWQFIYTPSMDQANVLLRGPYQPTTFVGPQIGTPASQMHGQQESGSGQQNNSGPQQNSP